MISTSSSGVTYTATGLCGISTVKVLDTDTNDVSSAFTSTINDNSVTIVKSGTVSAGTFTVQIIDSDGQTVTSELILLDPLTASISGTIKQGGNKQFNIANGSGTYTFTTDNINIQVRRNSDTVATIAVGSSVPIGTHTITIDDGVQTTTLDFTVVYANLTVSTTSGTCTRGGSLTVKVTGAVGAITAAVTTAEAQSYVTTSVNDDTDVVTINISDDLPDSVESFTVQYTDSRENALTSGGNGYKQYYLQS